MIINHDLRSNFLTRQNTLNTKESDKVYEKLGSALRINRAGDDASGLAVSEKMRSQIRGLNMAGRNAQDDISLIQTADGYLEDMTALVQRIRELAVTAGNGIYTSDDRELIQLEVDKLKMGIEKIIDYAEFNKLKLFDGKTFQFHIGANMDQNEKITIEKLDLSVLGIDDLNIGTQDNANMGIGKADKALKHINRVRADLGAVGNRLEKAYNGIKVNEENTTHAESRVRDTDMAEAITRYSTLNLLASVEATQMNNTHELNRTVITQILNQK